MLKLGERRRKTICLSRENVDLFCFKEDSTKLELCFSSFWSTLSLFVVFRFIFCFHFVIRNRFFNHSWLSIINYRLRTFQSWFNVFQKKRFFSRSMMIKFSSNQLIDFSLSLSCSYFGFNLSSSSSLFCCSNLFSIVVK